MRPGIELFAGAPIPLWQIISGQHHIVKRNIATRHAETLIHVHTDCEKNSR
jgi:hypothetical protein